MNLSPTKSIAHDSRLMFVKALADDLDITDSDDDEDDEEWEPVQDEDESQNLTVTIEPQAEIQFQEEPVQMEVHYPAQEEVCTYESLGYLKT